MYAEIIKFFEVPELVFAYVVLPFGVAARLIYLLLKKPDTADSYYSSEVGDEEWGVIKHPGEISGRLSKDHDYWLSPTHCLVPGNAFNHDND